MLAAVTAGARWLRNLLIVVILLYAAALLSLRMLGLDYAAVVSDSMQPATARGDLVLLRSKTNYQIGDVVTFERDGRVVLHRLVESLGRNSYRTKGDGNSAADPWRVAQRELQANAVGKISALGWPLLWLNETFSTPTVSSQFNSQVKVANRFESTYWGPFNFVWVKLLRGFFIDATSSGVLSISGFNDRRLYLDRIITGDTRIVFDGKLDQAPTDTSRLMFFMNACSASQSYDLNCGWVVNVKNSGADLRVLTNGTVLSQPLATCTFKSQLNLMQRNRLLISKNSSAIQISANGAPCVLTLNANQLVAPNQIPSGGRSGVWVTGQLGLDATAFLIF